MGIRVAVTLLAGAAALMTTPAFAQGPTNEWEWRASVYVWLPDIEGATKFPSGSGGPDIEIGADTLLKNLDFIFMAALQGRRGRWGVFTDLIYLNEGAHKTGLREFAVGPAGRPASVELDARLDLKSWIWTAAGTYSLFHEGRSTADLMVGVRMMDMDQALDWSFTGDIGGLGLPGRSGTSEAGFTNWDAVVGLRGNTYLGAGGRWFLPWHIDAGAGDSDLTWQAMAGIGYRFEWGSTILAWRYLDYDFDSDAGVTDFEFSGPLLGASFQW
jgi:hypothetical protein